MTRRALASLSALGCLAVVAACSGGAPSARPYVASASCPLKSAADWQGFLESAIADPSWLRTCSDLNDCDSATASPPSSPFFAHVEQDIASVFAQCSLDMTENPGIAACTHRFQRFVGAWHAQHSNDSYGFRQDNLSYFAAQTGPDVPAGMMDPPQEILDALPSRASVEQAARDHGFPYLTHDSGLGGVRTFINVNDPAGRFEQWFLFGLDPSAQQVEGPAIMSFIAVQLKDGAGRDLPQVRVHFRDYVVSQAPSGWQLDLPSSYAGKCYACHGGGTRALVPFHGSVVASAPVQGEPGYGDATPPSDFGYTRLGSFNQRLLGYGVPDWADTIRPEDHGPRLGSSLGCPSCHDDESQGALSVSTSEGMLHEKVIEQLSMRAVAPGQPVPDATAMSLLDREQTNAPPLSLAEQDALAQARSAHLADYQTLVAERQPALQAWVLATPCE